jgi:CRP/FNR family transcriptional regulator
MSAPTFAVPCEKCPLRQRPGFRKFTSDELKFVSAFKVGELRVPAGTQFLTDGEASPHLYTVLSGWAIRFKSFEDGRRQILNIAVAGDLLGLQSTLFSEMTHSIEALTDMVLCMLPRDRVWELYNTQPSLAFDVTWLAAREEQVLADQLANIGRRSAFHRTAHLLLLIFNRARTAGLVSGQKLVLPLTQEHIADAMGLSIVHTNKTLQRLRRTGWLTWDRGILVLKNEARLRELAEFSPPDNVKRPFL